MIDKCKGIRQSSRKMSVQETCIWKEVNYTPNFWKGSKCKETRDLLKCVMLSRTVLPEFLISPLLGEVKTDPHHVLESPEQLKKRGKNCMTGRETSQPLCLYGISFLLDTFCEITFSGTKMWAVRPLCFNTAFSNTFPLRNLFSVVLGTKKNRILEDFDVAPLRPALNTQVMRYPSLSLYTDGLFLSREITKKCYNFWHHHSSS